MNTPVLAESPVTQDAPTGDMPLRQSSHVPLASNKTGLVIVAVLIRTLPGISVLGLYSFHTRD